MYSRLTLVILLCLSVLTCTSALAKHDILKSVPKTCDFVYPDGRFGKEGISNGIEKDEFVVRRYMSAYLLPKPATMDALANKNMNYAHLTTIGLPKRILLYIVDWSAEPGSNHERPKGEYHVIANDVDGNTIHLTVNIVNGKIADIKKLPSPQGRKGTPLTKDDRIQILDLYTDKTTPRDNCYMDFDYSMNYKGYVRMGVNDSFTGVCNYLRRSNGKWTEIMSTQDVTLKSQLIKLQVPEDVQLELWGKDSIVDDTKHHTHKSK